MKNDIHGIKQELTEITGERAQRERERKQEKALKDFKKLCGDLIYTSIYDSLENGATLEEIYNERKNMINTILEDIKSRYIYVENINSLKDNKIKIREYNYQDYEIIDILSDCFYKQYIRAEREISKADNILKKELKEHLKEDFRKALNEKPADIRNKYMILSMQLSEHKNARIERLAKNDNERDILDSIYYKALNEIKREYPDTRTTKQGDGLALPWKLIAFRKALQTIWKL